MLSIGPQSMYVFCQGSLNSLVRTHHGPNRARSQKTRLILWFAAGQYSELLKVLHVGMCIDSLRTFGSPGYKRVSATSFK